MAGEALETERSMHHAAKEGGRARDIIHEGQKRATRDYVIATQSETD